MSIKRYGIEGGMGTGGQGSTCLFLGLLKLVVGLEFPGKRRC